MSDDCMYPIVDGKMLGLMDLLKKTSLGCVMTVMEFDPKEESGVKFLMNTDEILIPCELIKRSLDAEHPIALNWDTSKSEDQLIPMYGQVEIVILLHNVSDNNCRILQRNYLFSRMKDPNSDNFEYIFEDWTEYASVKVIGKLENDVFVRVTGINIQINTKNVIPFTAHQLMLVEDHKIEKEERKNERVTKRARLNSMSVE